WPKDGYSLLGLFFCITFTCNFVLTYEYVLVAGIGNTIANTNDSLKFMSRYFHFESLRAALGKAPVEILETCGNFGDLCKNAPLVGIYKWDEIQI
ncbi:hypothetical protein AVEN_149828-2-1, partial [Araneus ventricosus]